MPLSRAAQFQGFSPREACLLLRGSSFTFSLLHLTPHIAKSGEDTRRPGSIVIVVVAVGVHIAEVIVVVVIGGAEPPPDGPKGRKHRAWNYQTRTQYVAIPSFGPSS